MNVSKIDIISCLSKIPIVLSYHLYEIINMFQSYLVNIRLKIPL